MNPEKVVRQRKYWSELSRRFEVGTPSWLVAHAAMLACKRALVYAYWGLR